MSLHSFYNYITTSSSINDSTMQATPPPESPAKIDFLKLKSVSEFFYRYIHFDSLLRSEIHHSYKQSTGLPLPVDLIIFPEQVKVVQEAIKAGLDVFNEEPIKAIQIIDNMIQPLLKVLEEHQSKNSKNVINDISLNVLEEILARMSAETQDIKNDVNSILEKKGAHDMCSARPIYISRKSSSSFGL